MSDEIEGQVFDHPRYGEVRVTRTMPAVVEFRPVECDEWPAETELRCTFTRDAEPVGDRSE